ncbi:Rv2175c family DNA-binding protein [Cryobacterium breve]|uniref:Rv2175c family DNA-binding protein n=1 Tax=Cryobacterium breve TaxID=1259258 RepID=UPI003D7C2C9C
MTSRLLAIRRNGVISVPTAFIKDGSPLPELRGTLIVLADDGFTDEQAMQWLLEVDDSLGVPPIQALLAGRKAEVRRVAQALA